MLKVSRNLQFDIIKLGKCKAHICHKCNFEFYDDLGLNDNAKLLVKINPMTKKRFYHCTSCAKRIIKELSYGLESLEKELINFTLTDMFE